MIKISHLFLKNDKTKPFVLINDKIRHFLNYFSYFSYKNVLKISQNLRLDVL